jgi:hypothetical protein
VESKKQRLCLHTEKNNKKLIIYFLCELLCILFVFYEKATEMQINGIEMVIIYGNEGSTDGS